MRIVNRLWKPRSPRRVEYEHVAVRFINVMVRITDAALIDDGVTPQSILIERRRINHRGRFCDPVQDR